MANLKTLSGFPIQNLSSDPVPYAQALADNPYAGVWSSGGSLNTARGENFGNGVGTQTAAAVAGGATIPGSVAVHEQYDGTSWTEATDINTARDGTWADGTQPAFWVAGGGAPSYVTNTETWNGSSWTEVNELNTARAYGGGTCGRSSTAGLVVAGYTGTANSNAVESWDGTNWTEIAEVNSARRKASGFGTSTAAFAIGASPSPGNPGLDARVESWNGSSWTETTEINSGRGASSGAGTTTDGLIAGSEQSPTNALTENWNGTTWTEVNDLGTARGNFAGSGGTGSVAWAAGGTPGSGYVTNTEEWTFSGLPPSTPAAGYSDAIVGQMYYNSTSGQFKAIKDGGAPIGTWASTNNLNTIRASLAGAGTQTASLVFGGILQPSTAMAAVTESYDGTSFTEVNDLNTARGYRLGGAGTQTAALAFGGGSAPGAEFNETETWNGSSWTEVNNLNNARDNLGGAGFTNTASIAAGGYDTAVRAYTETWDGTNWTEVSDLNTAKAYGTLNGTSTDSIHAGGSTPSITGQVELWNGSSWTETTDLNTARSYLASSGTSTSVIVFGGYLGPPGSTGATEFWNGSSWTEVNDLGTTRYDSSGSGQSSSSALATGGFISDETNVAEEFTAADFTINPVTTS